MVYRCEELLLSYDKFYETKDQWDNIAVHTQKGISFVETYSHFVRDRCQVETEYARNLRRLVKTYQPKKKEDEEAQFTFVRAFREALNETSDLAGQHEVIAETLSSSVVQETHNLIKEIKDERKKYLSEGNKLQQQLQHSLQLLEKAKKNYEKAFKEAEKAQENYDKAYADLHLSRAEVEKQRMNSSIKCQQCDDQKNEYANQLQKTNQLQHAHYSTMMPGIFQSLQELDEKRIQQFQALLKKGVDCHKAVLPIIIKCLDGIVTAADSIQEEKDSQLVIEKYKSGFTPPVDIPFDDLSASKQNDAESTPVSHPPTRQDTIKGTISASKLRKRVGIFGIFSSNKNNGSFSEKEDFNDLPPNQRKKKIQLKIEEVNTKLQQETAGRDALLKMKEVYSSNPSLGDPASIIGQLNDSYQTIEKLRAELERYNAMLEDNERDPSTGGGTASGGPNTPTSSAFGRHANGGGGGASPRSSVASHRTSLSDESLSRSASDSSVCTNTPPPPPQLPNPSSSSVALATSTNNHHHTNFQSTPHRLTSTSLPNNNLTPTTTAAASPVVALAASTTAAAPTRTSTFNTSQKLNPILGSSHSPESGIGLSRNSLHGSDTYDRADGADDGEEYYDTEPLPVIGTCTALYNFEATSEGSMQMCEGEKLCLVELDQGDGWTRVRRMDVFEEGFVPTTYIQISLDNNC